MSKVIRIHQTGVSVLVLTDASSELQEEALKFARRGLDQFWEFTHDNIRYVLAGGQIVRVEIADEPGLEQYQGSMIINGGDF